MSEENLIPFGGADPVVKSVIDAKEKNKKAANLPKEERVRLSKHKNKAKDYKDRRVTYYINEDQVGRLLELAEQWQTNASQIACLLLEVGLRAVDAEIVDIDDYLVPNESPRYEFSIDLTGLPRDLFSKIGQ